MKTDEMNEEFADLSGLVDVSEEEAEGEVYEVGYHLLPSVNENALEAEAAQIKSAVTKLGGEVLGERTPALINFAYALGKRVDGKLQKFSNGYFGWVAFSLTPGALKEIKEVLDAHENVLRYLIVKTSRDQVAAIMADPTLDVGAIEPEVVEAVAESEVVAPEVEEEEAA